MAKMFYTIEETAEALGVDETQIKSMVDDGQLQQFRDRDRLMFKREEVEKLASNAASDTGGPIPLSDSALDDTGLGGSTAGGTDVIDLADDTSDKTAVPMEDSREATGISVFDAGEVDVADPMAQTQVTTPSYEDEDLVLESVGSGSGLLDLTRESDDTSLGAELLDEIYPGGEASDAKLDSAVGSSGVFEGAVSMETGSGPSGLEYLGEDTGAPSEVAPTTTTTVVTAAEPRDPVWSGIGFGLLLGACVAIVLSLAVALGEIQGVNSTVTEMMTEGENGVLMWCGGLLVGSLLVAAIGGFVGKAFAR